MPVQLTSDLQVGVGNSKEKKEEKNFQERFSTFCVCAMFEIGFIA